MLKYLFRRAVVRFGRRYGYDTRYLTALVDTDWRGAARLALVAPFAVSRFGLPPGPYYAARFVSARAAGCGSCALLVVAMAEDAGVSQESLAAAAAGCAGADPAMRLAAEFAAEVLRGGLGLPELSSRVVATFGARGRIGLAAAIAVGQFYPLLKRGMGAAVSCDILPPELRELPPAREAEKARHAA